MENLAKVEPVVAWTCRICLVDLYQIVMRFAVVVRSMVPSGE